MRCSSSDGGLGVAEAQIQPAGLLPVQDARLVALHDERGQGAEGDRVDAVGVAVEVQLDDVGRVEDAQVRAAAGDGLILRPVHGDDVAGVRPGAHQVAVHPLGAGHGAAVDAGVGVRLGEEPVPNRGVDLGHVGVAAELEVVHRQQVVIVHDLDQVRGAHAAHLVLLVVQLDDLPVDALAHGPDALDVGRIVGVRLHAGVADDDGLDPLVAQHRAQPAAAGLLDTGHPPLGIVPAHVEAADAGVLAALPGRHHRHVAPVRLVARVHLGELIGERVGVHPFQRRFLDGDAPRLAFDENDHIPLGLALDFERIPARELQQRAEVAAHVAVHDDVGQRGDADHQRLAGAGVEHGAGDGAGRDHDLVLGIVPLRLRRHRMPQPPQPEPLAADEDALHLVGDGAGLDVAGGDVDVEGLAGVAAVNLGDGVGELGEDAVGLFQVLRGQFRHR